MKPKFRLHLILLLVFSLLSLRLALLAADSVAQETHRPSGSTKKAYLPLIRKPATLTSKISAAAINLPVALEGSAGSWCTWGGCVLGPRLYHAPLPDDSTLVGWTDVNGNGHISHKRGATVNHWDFPGTAVRGLVSHDDNSFAVLLWDPAQKRIWLSKRSQNNGEIWTTTLNSTIAVADFWLGDGRLTYGNGLYAAYFTVKGVSGGFTGHHGDQMSYVDAHGNKLPGNFPDGWDWGCSHSMAQSIAYHPGLNKFAAICSSDCFPDASIHWVNASHQIYQAAGNCGGNVSAQLGQIALGNNAWKLVFNAIAQPCCEGQGIALATLQASEQSQYVWLTQTNGEFERDPVIARLGLSSGPEKYLVGWLTTNNNVYRLGIIDANGRFLVGPEVVSTSGVGWGNRDDSFRTRADGTISWVQGNPNGQTLTLFRFNGEAFLASTNVNN